VWPACLGMEVIRIGWCVAGDRVGECMRQEAGGVVFLFHNEC
jgi:hypothetical protein